MLRYVLKRLLLLLPTLWIICSLVFLLSKAVPGTCLDWQLGEVGQTLRGLGTNNGTTAAEPILPLFYFSLRSGAEPDTLYRVQPESNRLFLKNLVLTYGNWPAIAAFYHTLTALQKELPGVLQVAAANKQQLTRQFQVIFSSSEEKSIRQALLQVKSQAIRQQFPASFNRQIEFGLQQLQAITQQAQPVRILIPAITWHGVNNQYHSWLKTFIQGDLGVSCLDQEPVNKIIAEAFANTFIITGLSLGLIFFLALELSIWLSKSAQFKRRRVVLALLYALDSVPLFITALALLTLFASSTYLNIFPVYGSGLDAAVGVPNYLAWIYRLPYFALPVISLTLANLPYVTGQAYQAVQQLQLRDFVLTAKAKGLSERVVLRRHVWRNAWLPIITLFTGFLPALVTGTVVIEIIYAIPGMGNLLNQAVLARNYPVLMGIVLYLGLIKMASHILADVLYYLADPRIRVPA